MPVAEQPWPLSDGWTRPDEPLKRRDVDIKLPPLKQTERGGSRLPILNYV
jgi:hypothetical protein